MKHRPVHGGLGAALLTALALAMVPGIVAPARAADKPAATAGAEKPAKQKKTREPKQKQQTAPQVRKERDLNDPWDRGATWLSVRAGCAKAEYDGAANGNLGYGFGFSHMVFHAWSLGGYAQYDVLGRFGDAAESELPFTLEAARHFKWGSAFHPYVGAGGGAYYHKTYRTGADVSDARKGGYFLMGANTPVSTRGLLGLDVRISIVNGVKGRVNPVFGVEKASTMHWSVKLNWSHIY